MYVYVYVYVYVYMYVYAKYVHKYMAKLPRRRMRIKAYTNAVVRLSLRCLHEARRRMCITAVIAS